MLEGIRDFLASLGDHHFHVLCFSHQRLHEKSKGNLFGIRDILGFLQSGLCNQ